MVYVKEILSNKILDVLCVSETWFKPIYSDLYSKIDGYVCTRLDRTQKGGGGVCMCVRELFKTKLLVTSGGLFDNNLEFIITKMSHGHTKIICSVVYRRP